MIDRSLKRFFYPALLVYSKKEALAKLAFTKRRFPSSHMHVDVMDNEFVPASCWCTPRDFRSLPMPKSYEVHLMVYRPERRIAAWKKAGATRAIFHIEAAHDPRMVIRAIRAARLEAGIAINPKTPLSKLKLFLPQVDAILVMGVNPGWAGQAFISTVRKKIRALRKTTDRLIIIDGGVTEKNARALVALGADRLVSTSAIYGKNIAAQ